MHQSECVEDLIVGRITKKGIIKNRPKNNEFNIVNIILGCNPKKKYSISPILAFQSPILIIDLTIILLKVIEPSPK